MIAKSLNKFFLFITSRELFILIAGLMTLSAIPMILEQFTFLKFYFTGTGTAQNIEGIEGMIDALAGILVAGGVFFEERETLRELSFQKSEKNPELHDYLNKIGHHNGMGILLLGLFMEICTLLIRLPEKFMVTHTLEAILVGICLLMSVFSVLILLDFKKDYIKTYFNKYADFFKNNEI